MGFGNKSPGSGSTDDANIVPLSGTAHSTGIGAGAGYKPGFAGGSLPGSSDANVAGVSGGASPGQQNNFAAQGKVPSNGKSGSYENKENNPSNPNNQNNPTVNSNSNYYNNNNNKNNMSNSNRNSVGSQAVGVSGGSASKAVDGSGDLYRFKYTLDYNGHVETGSRNGNKQGSYFVIGPDNIKRTIEYIANEFGFQPHVTYQKLDDTNARPEENTLKDYEFLWFNKELQ